MPKLTPEDYDSLARRALLDLIDREDAVVWPEAEAKLADRPYHAGDVHLSGINPHHLTTARTRLLKEGLIVRVEEVTRGGGTIAVFGLYNRRRRETAFDRAAGRKRLLQTRYLSWTRAAPGRYPNLIGDGGEFVAHSSLVAAATTGVGYLLTKPAGGEIPRLFGHPVPGGSLDDAAHLTALTPDQIPTTFTVLVEVKNLRRWLYPQDHELFQLLDKAAQLQLAHPRQSLVPVLICRRAHYLTFTMAKDLGFRIFYTISQPILPHSEAPPEAVDEVNGSLGYQLSRSTEAHPKLTEGFAQTLPRHASDIAARWRQSAPIVGPFAEQLREDIDPNRRMTLMRELKEVIVRDLPDAGGPWLGQARAAEEEEIFDE